MRSHLGLFLSTACALSLGAGEGVTETPFEQALSRGETALASGDFEPARRALERALERDPRSTAAWDLRARLADASGARDEHVYARHVEYRLAVAQGLTRSDRDAMRERLQEIDPLAKELIDLRKVYIKKLLPVAAQHEKDKRPHSAIRVHQEILALDPERTASLDAIERLSANPDPSLAETAKPKDLLADVSEEWIREFDAKHSDWERRAELARDNYTTYTDAGYEMLVRAAEAMEQMNGFYREFFQYGIEGDGRQIPPIKLHIFKDRDEYLAQGLGPPVEWSGGHYTGSHVETYVQGSFSGTVGVLFHECAHQFVSLATTAQGWLNEGLASFFEGCRILANGTVIMNMPANHRLFALAGRMDVGWMADSWDGIPRGNPSEGTPDKAPRMRTVIENAYPWGPPWYAPTWGFVFFLWNYQDAVDGRFVYRDSFRDFINLSGGRRGPQAVENFELVVLGNPSKPMKGVDYEDQTARLPKTAEEVDEVWREWILRLRDEVSGLEVEERPYRQWALFAEQRKEYLVAKEHYEKGLVAQPEDVQLLVDFGKLLVGEFKNKDRASKLAMQALQALERQESVDEDEVKRVEKLLRGWDRRHLTLSRIHTQLEATSLSLARRYLEAGLPTVAADLSWRLGSDLGYAKLFEVFEEAVYAGSQPLVLWKLAYDESSLRGWDDAGTDDWTANGVELESEYGKWGAGEEPAFDFRFLSYDTVTSGDFSLEAELYADGATNSFAGLMFGRKSDTSFHTLVYHPGRRGDVRYQQEARQDSVDLTTFYGAGEFEIHRHNLIGAANPVWHSLRIDVVGREVDVWFDGALVVTHEFPNLDVLRGGFGLLTGPGQARWRNIRYLARPARDPGAVLERELRMRRMKEEAAARGERVGISYVDLIPPFPFQIRGWKQEPLASWWDLGPVPVVLLFWSVEQNEKIPLHDWLNHLLAKYEDVGLRIVSVVHADDKEVQGYLREVGFPGSVALDKRVGVGYGETFEQYLVHRFGMPRVLLLDVDHRVAWEGDPGFDFAKGWNKVDGSYLDAPLDNLIKKRHLRDLRAFEEAWLSEGESELRQGHFAAVLPLLKKLRELDDVAEVHPGIDWLHQRFEITEAALIGLEATAESLAHQDAEGALATLFDWSNALGHPVTDSMKRDLRSYTSSRNARGWAAAEKEVARVRARWDPSNPDRFVVLGESLAEDLDRMAGLFPGILSDELQRAAERGDAELVKWVLDESEHVPDRWLFSEFFGW